MKLSSDCLNEIKKSYFELLKKKGWKWWSDSKYMTNGCVIKESPRGAYRVSTRLYNNSYCTIITVEFHKPFECRFTRCSSVFMAEYDGSWNNVIQKIQHRYPQRHKSKEFAEIISALSRIDELGVFA